MIARFPRSRAAEVDLAASQEAWEFLHRCLDAHPRNNDAKHLQQELEELIEKELKRLDSQVWLLHVYIRTERTHASSQ